MPFTTQWPTNRLLSTAARLVEHAWNERLATLGVTHAGVMALDVLRTAGSMTQAQLAQRVRVQAQTMGKTLHRLELHGHVTRSKNVRDRRSHLVSITPEGERILEAATQLEDELVGDGLLTDESLRRTLADIITTLGGARWKLRVQSDGTVTDAGSPDATSAAAVREVTDDADVTEITDVTETTDSPEDTDVPEVTDDADVTEDTDVPEDTGAGAQGGATS